MNAYSFLIHGTPRPGSSEYERLASAEIHIWVVAADLETAERLARLYISRYNWTPGETGYAVEVPPEVVPRLRPSEARLYQRACRQRIAAEFVAVARESQGANVVEYRPLEP